MPQHFLKQAASKLKVGTFEPHAVTAATKRCAPPHLVLLMPALLIILLSALNQKTSLVTDASGTMHSAGGLSDERLRLAPGNASTAGSAS